MRALISMISTLVKRIILAGSCSLYVLGCNEEAGHLPMETMSHVLLEMHIAESYAQYVPRDSNQSDLKNRDSLRRYYALILEENQISEQEFKQSMDWYKQRPDLLDSVYQQILADLSVWQTRINLK